MGCYVQMYLPDKFLKKKSLMLLKLSHSSLAVYGQVNLWGYCLDFCSKFLLNPIPAKQRGKKDQES